ncbi:MAG: alcohol dehydrogenase [Actinobacteria bacterium HGW-Actinobacteria-7]|nr:MAG: alcohol dehydrogenase [Actinobacteria bacterium HGW-Actinobacteria-7]
MRKFVAPEFVFGVDARGLAGRYTANFGAKKVLVVSDPGVCEAGWTDAVMASLADAGIETTLYTDVTPNPRSHEAMRGAEEYRAHGCQAVVAVGGGSPMDCAKGICVVVSNGGDILVYEGVDRIPIPMPPLVCVPTTAGTAADVSQFCIITDEHRDVKIALVSKALVPDVALIDAETLVTMPADLTAATGLDALVHAVEAFSSNASWEITDLCALRAIEGVFRWLEPCMDDPLSIESRTGMALASLEAGLAFSNASLGATHAMAHALGGKLDLPHGECNALLLEHVLNFNLPVFSAGRRVQLARAMGIAIDSATDVEPQAISERLHLFRHGIGVVDSLSSLGVTRADLPLLAETAMGDACMVTNPRRPQQEDIEAIYEAAF